MGYQEDKYIIRMYSEDEDGIVTDRVDLTDGVSYGVGPGGVLAPPPPQKVARGADSAYRHGSDVVRVRYGNSRVDIRELTILGTRPEQLAERIRRITTLLEKARYRQERGWGERVFVERDWRLSTYYTWDLDPGPEYFYEVPHVLRKEVLRGEFIPPREDIAEFIAKGLLAGCRLDLECYPFWQGLQTMPIYERNIQNHDEVSCGDPARNYVDLLAADVPGDAPALLKVVIENRAGVSRYYKRFRLGAMRDFSGTLTWQSEDYKQKGATVADFPAVPPDADFSCGEGVRVTPTTTNMVWRLFFDDILQSELPDGQYRAFVRIRNNDHANVDLKVRMRLGLDVVSWTGKAVDVPEPALGATELFTLVDLGIVPIPPVRWGAQAATGTNCGYNFFIDTQADAFGAYTHDIDYILFIPVHIASKLLKMPDFSASSTMWDYESRMCVDGFMQPPLSYVINLITGTWCLNEPPQEDLNFAQLLEPNFDYRIFFSVDEKEFNFGDTFNRLESDMKIWVEVIPQYLYIR